MCEHDAEQNHVSRNAEGRKVARKRARGDGEDDDGRDEMEDER